jgi:hypothetical protein
MADGTDIEVWLEWSKSRPVVIVPHARSTAPAERDYRIELSRNISRMVQQGRVRLEPGVATPLSRMSVSRVPDDICTVEVMLEGPGAETLVRVFDCPP